MNASRDQEIPDLTGFKLANLPVHYLEGQEGSDQGAQVKWTDICKPKSKSGWGLRFGDLEQGMHGPTFMVYPNPSRFIMDCLVKYLRA
ncbi:hypothetical protein J1N35_007833 [Gossypium stocksii]|uniref:Uncharacterized protein n=1 Tax=Gossypium stocksii TaxID=47602 RepID=A0A9D3W972_9ROSI|nr:hypothetical protein J1N35_007833 [Gossypium stocksii]